MKPTRFGKNRLALASAAAVLFLAAIGLFMARSGRQEPPPSTPRANPAGFTFADVDADTRLSDRLTAQLESQLGSAVTEQWSDLDLTLNYRGFLEEYFPELTILNRNLKREAAPLKPEKNPLRLTFRHTRDKDTPFADVAMVFSPYTRKPMFFKLRPKKPQGADVMAAIREKYGPPRREISWDDSITLDDSITWDGNRGRSFIWGIGTDLLIVSVSPDRYGDPAYEIAIFYVANMSETLRIKEAREAAPTGNPAKDAF